MNAVYLSTGTANGSYYAANNNKILGNGNTSTTVDAGSYSERYNNTITIQGTVQGIQGTGGGGGTADILKLTHR
ncbi:hypothetical protein X275_06605 [Marinitoga sp. 1197]|uniref:hypothetical protein n=1 Tax=Marinitoga sp. 1197 TaxID=1428449 RepID=UPI000641286F|nr:hypothetical protein [Marinitoga sp. 1197]KLO22080.1 hypothetical protein X275_06605 [Marinitoga sp. 1197]